MRQIDNMTPNEIETLALKGMTAPKNDPNKNWAMYNPDKANPRIIPAEICPECEVEEGHDASCSEVGAHWDRAEKPTAPSWRQARLEELQEWYLSACKGRQEAQTEVALLQAQAAQLAEALREIVEHPYWKGISIKATEALAAYEATRQ